MPARLQGLGAFTGGLIPPDRLQASGCALDAELQHHQRAVGARGFPHLGDDLSGRRICEQLAQPRFVPSRDKLGDALAEQLRGCIRAVRTRPS
jgi:hypothetical protein